MGVEYTMSVNSFNEPEKKEGFKAMATLIIRLLLLDPGTYLSDPEMGVGVITKYRYCEATELSKLRQDIMKQLHKYLPEVNAEDIAVGYNRDKQLIIEIKSSSGATYLLGTADFESVVLMDIIT